MTQETQESLDDVQVGRILHYVIEKYGKPKCRPAIVVEDWPESGRPGYVNLVVFPDGTNDEKYGIDSHGHSYGYQSGEMIIGGPSNYVATNTGPANTSLLTRWETSVTPQHAVKAVRTWHWPRECPKLVMPEDPFKHEDEGLIHHNHAPGLVDTRNCYACTRKAAASARG